MLEHQPEWTFRPTGREILNVSPDGTVTIAADATADELRHVVTLLVAGHPDVARLDWCTEHVEEFTRAHDLPLMDWAGEDLETHTTSTHGKDWRATIDLAMREDAALTAQIAEGVRAEQDRAAEVSDG